GAELDSIRALFSEKEKELSVAVAKVEELTRQLEEARRSNRLQGSRTIVSPTNAAHELDKLRKELMVHAQLTEQQSARIAQQREALSRRQGEVADMDRRIGELQQRLLKKRLHNQALQALAPPPPWWAQQSNDVPQESDRALCTRVSYRSEHHKLCERIDRNNDVAVSTLASRERGPPPSKKDPKYQTLPYNTKFCLKPRPEAPKEIAKNSVKPGSNQKRSPHRACPPTGTGKIPVRHRDVTAAFLTGGTLGKRRSDSRRPSRSRAFPPSPWFPPSLRRAPGPHRGSRQKRPPTTSTRDPPTASPKPSGHRPPPKVSDDGSASGAKALDKISCDDKVPKCDRHRVTRADFAAVLPHFDICPEVHIDFTLEYVAANVLASSVADENNFSSPWMRETADNSLSRVTNNHIHWNQITVTEPITVSPRYILKTARTPKPRGGRHFQGWKEKEEELSYKTKQRWRPSAKCIGNGDPAKFELILTFDPRTEGDGGAREEPHASDSDTGSEDQPQQQRVGSCPASESSGAKKGNLKTQGSAKNPHRVSFDPLALLLDAALEGELELVKKTALEVPNPSAANDEGITALHNAICAGHFDIVKFLVEFGCDVNAQDSDGWTPLHCAASCNNLAMVKFLVEHGACIFAATLSDHETAAEKCEEDEEGFDNCSEYLYSVQEKLGILHGGVAYGVFAYEAHNPDELSFAEGDMVLVLRKGDDAERHWWWARLGDQEGYLPRNLLGVSASHSSR
ncbi:unnamed protein product, partial [Ixodes hexagonus]